MKQFVIVLFLCILILPYHLFCDIESLTTTRIKELEKEIENAQKKLKEIENEQLNKQKKVNEINKNVSNLKNQISKLKRLQNYTKTELKNINKDINVWDNCIIENSILLGKLVKKASKLNKQNQYLDPYFKQKIEMTIVNQSIKSILSNLENFYSIYLSRKIESKQKENKFQLLTEKLHYNESKFQYALSKKDLEEEDLSLLINIEKDYKEHIDEIKYGISTLENFIKEKEAEKFGKEYDFKFVNGTVWPLKGKILQNYKECATDNSNIIVKNEGIFIASEQGDSVKAIASGVIAYAGWFQNKGNLVIVDHQNGFYSLYGFNDRIVVNKGQNVLQGETIAFSGKNLLINDNCLYFELRKSGEPVDPLEYLGDNNPIP